MRRRVSLFLLILLPFQFVWAGVGAYIVHDAGAASFHYGDHEHPVNAHHTDPNMATGAGPDLPHPVPSGGDHAAHASDCTCGDCDDCSHDVHAHFVAVACESFTPSSFAVTRGIAMPSRTRLDTAPPTRPERPNWRMPA